MPFLKENWFRLGILGLFAVLIALAAYFVLVFQPSLAAKNRADEIRQQTLDHNRTICEAEEAQNQKGNDSLLNQATVACNQTNDPVACIKSFVAGSENSMAPTGQAFIDACVARMDSGL